MVDYVEKILANQLHHLGTTVRVDFESVTKTED